MRGIGTTISGMMGRGSIRHNNREFTAANVDRNRSGQNIVFVNEDLKQVYHELFDEALESYNAGKKKTRDKIPDYYEHIRQSKQEKLFHEAIFQIGNLSDCGCGSEGGQRAAEALTEFAKTFQERNPPSPGVQHGAAHGRGHAAPSCRLYPGGNGADAGPVRESIHEAGPQAAGLYRDWSETDRVEDLDGSGEGRSDGDRPAARI